MAYLCLLRLSLKYNSHAKSWSIFQAKWNLLAWVFQDRQIHFRKTEATTSDEYLATG